MHAARLLLSLYITPVEGCGGSGVLVPHRLPFILSAGLRGRGMLTAVPMRPLSKWRTAAACVCLSRSAWRVVCFATLRVSVCLSLKKCIAFLHSLAAVVAGRHVKVGGVG